MTREHKLYSGSNYILEGVLPRTEYLVHKFQNVYCDRGVGLGMHASVRCDFISRCNGTGISARGALVVGNNAFI